MIGTDNIELFADYLASLILKSDKLSWASTGDTVSRVHQQAKSFKYPVSFNRIFSQYFMVEYSHQILALKPGQVLSVHSKDTSFKSVMVKAGVPVDFIPPFLYFQFWGDGAILVKRGFNMDWRVFWSHSNCKICYYMCVVPFQGPEKFEEGVFVSPPFMSGSLEFTHAVGHPIEIDVLKVSHGWFGYGETQKEARLNAFEAREVDHEGALELLRLAGYYNYEAE